MKKGITIFIAILFLLSTQQTVFAQYSLDNLPGANDPLTLVVTPQNPEPGQTVYVQVQSLALKLDTTKITWTINGIVQSTSNNNKTLSLQAGNTGSSQMVEVTVQTLSNRVYTKSVTINPASIDLVWEAHSYVPPFYKGKPLLPYQGQMVIQAIPTFSSNGTVSDAKNLIYTWKNDDNVLGDASGYGKDSAILNLSGILMRPMTISVTATTKDGTAAASGSVTITPQSPSLYIYQNNPLYGILYNSTVPTNFTMQNSELVIDAAPYFFSSEPNEPFFGNFDWKINGTSVSTENNGNQDLDLRKPDGVKGTSEISVKTTNADKILQYTTAELQVNF